MALKVKVNNDEVEKDLLSKMKELGLTIDFDESNEDDKTDED